MEDAGDRRKRLQALREKAASKTTATSTATTKPTLKFRNYRPNDTSIKEKLGDSSAAGSTEGSTGRADSQDYGRKRRKDEGRGEDVNTDAEEEKRQAPAESLIQQELKKQKETQDEEELNIAPKKVNWDLKRDVEKKLDKLNRRTQRAIVEIIRERMAEEAARGSGSSSGSDEEGTSSSDSGSESDSDGGAGSVGKDDDGSSGSSDSG